MADGGGGEVRPCAAAGRKGIPAKPDGGTLRRESACLPAKWVTPWVVRARAQAVVALAMKAPTDTGEDTRSGVAANWNPNEGLEPI